jgi:hypothetical protein
MKMKKQILISLILLGSIWTMNAQTQTLYLPNGAAGIGSNTINSNVGIGTNIPDAPFTVYGISHIYPNMFHVGDMRQFSISYTLSNPSFINNDFPIVLGTGGGNQPLILDAARIGIGTLNPDSKLTINGDFKVANGNNEFSYNGLADIVFRYNDRGTGGRAIVHDVNNTLVLNYGGDFTGGTRIGNDVHFKDGGNSFIYSGNFGIGTKFPFSKLSYGTGAAFNTAAKRLAIEEGNDGSYFYGIGGYIENSNDIATAGLGIWGGTESQLPWNGATGRKPDIFIKRNSGNVGIGTTTPDAPLTVFGVSHIYPNMVGAMDSRQFSISSTASLPGFISNGYPIVLATGGGNQPLILDAARIGIGTINPSCRLDVCGTIRANEIKVDLSSGCDFVFKNDYKLMDLKTLDEFVKTNQHLPEVASEKEMVENGVNMKELQMKLLQKIEELTLYTIEQNKKLEQQNLDILELKKQNERIKTLEEKIQRIESSSK